MRSSLSLGFSLLRSLWVCFVVALAWGRVLGARDDHYPLLTLPRVYQEVDNSPLGARDHSISSLFGMIDVHQKILSPADGPRSHFVPVSSTYARGALKRFGWGGLLLAFDRLMRENEEEWVYPPGERDGMVVKSDPIPQPGT